MSVKQPYKTQPPTKPRPERKNPKRNTNCLVGMQCPKCKSLEPFSIQVHCIAEVHDDGIEITSEHAWDENSFCSCDRCHYQESVREFEVKK